LNRSTKMTTRPWRAGGTDRLAIAIRIAASLAALAMVLVLVAGCGPAPATPEAQLRDWVAAVETAAEEKQHAPILELIATSYNDARGNSRQDIDQLLRLYFLHQDQVAILTSIDEIEVTGGTAATMTVNAGMAGTREYAQGFSADAWHFELELEAGDAPESYADWRLLSARWGALGEPLR
jgi:hypothetical protein